MAISDGRSIPMEKPFARNVVVGAVVLMLTGCASSPYERGGNPQRLESTRCGTGLYGVCVQGATRERKLLLQPGLFIPFQRRPPKPYRPRPRPTWNLDDQRHARYLSRCQGIQSGIIRVQTHGLTAFTLVAETILTNSHLLSRSTLTTKLCPSKILELFLLLHSIMSMTLSKNSANLCTTANVANSRRWAEPKWCLVWGIRTRA